MNPVSQAASRIARWRESPPTFVRDVFRAEPDRWQDIVLEAVPDNPRGALKASKGPGKSTVLAWIGWWFLCCFPHPKGAATSISGDNLKDGLWAEFAKWQVRSELTKQAFTHTSERIFANDHPKTWFFSARTWPRDASTEKQADTLAGFHGDFVMFLVDESGGIPRAVFAAAEAGLANAGEEGRKAWLWQAGNPTDTQGPLYDACTRERHLWFVFEISGDPDDPNRAPRISKQWAREQIAKYGRDDPWVRVNVFGKFPLGQSNVLVAVDDATKASKRNLMAAEYRYAPRVLGVDVARFGGDRTVLFPRQGKVAFRPEVLRSRDTMQVAGQVVRIIDSWRPHQVFVDAIGVGAGVVDRLRELGHDMVIGVESSSSPTQPRYLNLRAEMWDKMATWVRTEASTPDDPELIRELTAPTYKYNSEGLLVLEKKDDIKKRLGFSPDKADGLALTFAYDVATPDPALEDAATARFAKHGNRKLATEYEPFAGEA